jgi:hypothetical protein
MKTSVNFLHHQANDWLRELDFYRQETGILERRLEDVVKSNNKQDVLAQVEQFQNKFIMYREQMDLLSHNIRERRSGLETIAKDRPEHIGEKFAKGSDEQFGELQSFVSGFLENRKDFNRFLSSVL